MKFKLDQIAEILGGTIEGDGSREVNQLEAIEKADQSALSFLANLKYEKFIYTTKAAGVIVNRDFAPKQALNCTLIRVDDAYSAFADLLNYYNQLITEVEERESPSYIHPDAQIGAGTRIGAFAYIAKGAKIGKNCVIHPHVYIGAQAVVGDDCVFHSGVRIGHLCKLGHNCTLHFGVNVGSDGFGFAPVQSGYKKVAQVGNVEVGDGVEIGANTTIDRATMGSTVIGDGVKLDNLIQIAHNVEIGKNTVMAAQCGISGSTKIGENCMFGGQVGIAGHLTIGNGVKIAAQSGVAQSVPDGAVIMGSPAIDAREHQRSFILFKRFPTLAKKIHDLEKKITP
ncbi:MAG: UDP-3-O-(3-hydroxymyristoyl)glucosamine N-acyltransferase [Cryomorphaceae bacterium]|nr:UDP-3-O-(3-hydroxymyristoyl)glucosamine N-acyltransferase [Cryomorphaceae bacterium]